MKNFFIKWHNYLFYFLLVSFSGSLLLTGQLFVFHLSLFLFIFIFIFTKSYYWINLKTLSKNFILKTFIISFVIRVFFVGVFYFILEYFVGIPFLTLKDDYSYYLSSAKIAEQWSLSGIGLVNNVGFSTGFYSGYPYFSAFCTYFFNGDPIIMPRIGNAFFSALTVILVYKLTRLYSAEKESRLVAVIFMFSPLFITYSSLQLKDTILLFLSLVIIYFLSKTLLNKITSVGILLIILCSGLIILFRAAALIPIFGGFFFIILFNIFNKTIRNNWKNYFYVIPIIAGFYFIWFNLSANGFISSTIEAYVESRSAFILDGDYQNSSIKLSDSNFSNLLSTPIFLLGSFFLPPFLIVSLPDAETINYAFVGMLTHFSLLPFLIIAVFNTIKFRKNFLIPFFILVLFIFFKIGQANSLVSIFDPRQSLTTIALMYLLLPMYFIRTSKKRMLSIIIVISIIIIISYAFVRLSSRGLI